MRLRKIKWESGHAGSFLAYMSGMYVSTCPSGHKQPKFWHWCFEAGDEDHDRYFYSKSGRADTNSEAMLLAENAMLEHLMSFLEPDDAPTSPRNNEASGQGASGDGCGGSCPDCHKWVQHCDCGPAHAGHEAIHGSGL